MSFPRYPAYRPTDYSWLGEIPSTWSIQKFRHLFKESSEKIESEVFGEMLSVSGYRGIELKEYDDENRRRRDEDLVGYRIVRKGQLVVNTMWLNYAGLGFSDLDGHVSPAYRAYWLRSGENTQYLHYLLRSEHYVKGYTRLLTGVRPNSLQMSRDNMMSFPVILPPYSEQVAIARFLDRETAKLEALIAEQQRLIELLQEKRQAVISHAVTKGLNPDAPMKDSGVEWLGEVPEHWVVNKLGRELLQAPCYGVLVPDYQEDGIPMIRINDLGDGIIGPEVRRIKPNQSQEYSRTLIEAGDVLIGVVGTIGRPVLVDSRSEGWNLSRAVARLVTRKDSLLPSFLALALESSVLSHYKDLVCTGTAQIVLNMQDLSALKIAVPPLGEQGEVVRLTTPRIEELRESVRLALATIDLLGERRSALISAAVTGQIDVRGLVSEEEP